MRSVLSNDSRWARFADGLAANESPASRMVTATGSRAQLARLFSHFDDREVELLVFDLDF